MTENTVTSKDTKNQEPIALTSLSNLLFELGEARIILEERAKSDAEDGFLLLLIKATEEKIEYYQEKYNLKVPENDSFYLEDLIDFVRAKDVYAKGGEV